MVVARTACLDRSDRLNPATLDPGLGVRVRDLVELIRAYQIPDGSVRPEHQRWVVGQLEHLIELLAPTALHFPTLPTCLGDIRAWVAQGLTTPPTMHGLLAQGLGPLGEGPDDALLIVANPAGHPAGWRLEWVLYRAQLGPPTAALLADYPSPALRVAHILEATAGLGPGSGVARLVAAGLAGACECGSSRFSLAFTCSLEARLQGVLQQVLETVLGLGSCRTLRNIQPARYSDLVAVTAIVREWHRHHGPLPSATFPGMYRDTVSGGFEEAYADLSGAHTLYERQSCGKPDAELYQAAAQLILVDRIFGVSVVSQPRHSVDSMAGQYCLGQLLQRRLLTFDGRSVHFANSAALRKGIAEIIVEMDVVKRRALAAGAQQARRAIHDHVGAYAHTLNTEGAASRTLFHSWLLTRMRSSALLVPITN